MDLNETICFCNDVTIGMIKDASGFRGQTLEDVQAQTAPVPCAEGVWTTSRLSLMN